MKEKNMPEQTKNEYMVKVAAAHNVREVYEVRSSTMATAVDAMHYATTKQVRYISRFGGMMLPISEFEPFEFVEITTGHEEGDAQSTVVYIKAQQAQRAYA